MPGFGKVKTARIATACLGDRFRVYRRGRIREIHPSHFGVSQDLLLLTIVRLFPKVSGEAGARQTMMKYEGI